MLLCSSLSLRLRCSGPPPEEIDLNQLLKVLTEADLLTLRAGVCLFSAGFMEPKIQIKKLIGYVP